MRDLIDILTESVAPDDDNDVHIGDMGEIQFGKNFHHGFPSDEIFDQIIRSLFKRSPVSLVFGLVLDGIPFDDAVNHIAKRDKIDPYELRANAMTQYKKLRGDPVSYDDPDKVALVAALNDVIREACEALLNNNKRLV